MKYDEIKMNTKNYIWAVVLLLIVFMNSCVKDEYKDKKAEEERMISEYIEANEITEAHKLESGVYLKLISNSGSNTYAVDNNYVIVSYTGKYTDETVFDSNIESVAVTAGLYNDTLVYGSSKLKVGSTQIAGFNIAVKEIPEGSSAVMVIPSDLAQKDYNPLVFEVELHQVITSTDTFEIEQFQDFLTHKGFDDDDTLVNGIYYHIAREGGEDADTVASGDSLVIEITGQYAELENYIEGVDQRTFYPLGSQPDTILYVYGTPGIFPIPSGLEMAMESMREGDRLEVVMHSYYGYGNSGYFNDILNIHIVQPFTPLYYSVKLIAIIREE
jgi:FKBP-type peptidyl-prolyl cis-trans isomerase